MTSPKKTGPDQDSADTAAAAEPATEAETAARPAGGDYEPYPGAAYFHGGRTSEVIAAMAVRLHQEGHADRRLGPDWTNAHRRAFASFQESLRPKGGGDTSGIPDETAWEKLRVPRVTPVREA